MLKHTTILAAILLTGVMLGVTSGSLYQGAGDKLTKLHGYILENDPSLNLPKGEEFIGDIPMKK